MGSVASLQHWDSGSIPGPAQWVKGSGIGTECSVGHNCGSNLIPGHRDHNGPLLILWDSQKKKKKKKKRGLEKQVSCPVLLSGGKLLLNIVS